MVFSQSAPLSTEGFVAEAKDRGLSIDHKILRELYRHGDLAPLLEITGRRVSAGMRPAEDHRTGSNPCFNQLRNALNAGRVRDPAESPFRPKVRFDTRRLADRRGWSNGLTYSRWQLLTIPDLRTRVAKSRVIGPYGHQRTVLPQRSINAGSAPADYRRWAIVIAVLEARYLPTIGLDFLELSNVDPEAWQKFREDFDPVNTAADLQISPNEARKFAERLLSRAHTLDPTGDWSKLITRAPSRAWKSLRGDALVALDHRLAAEILLTFVEDLASRGAAEALPETNSFSRSWHPLIERISARRDTPLDEILGDLGVSPHAKVVLAVEGETEEILVPRVFDELGLRRSPDLLRILCMRTEGRDLSMVIALTVAPLLGERQGDHYWMIRPPTAVMVAVDPGQVWATQAKVEERRRNWIKEIQNVVKAQGGEVDETELEKLVQVRLWKQTCFEFEHFTDQELAQTISVLHPNSGGLDLPGLVDLIAAKRSAGVDIKEVWFGWNPQIRKPELANALWPTLRDKIHRAQSDPAADVPPIAAVALDAHDLAQSFNFGRYIIRAKSD